MTRRVYERALGRSEKASKQFGTSVTGMSRKASIGFGLCSRVPLRWGLSLRLREEDYQRRSLRHL